MVRFKFFRSFTGHPQTDRNLTNIQNVINQIGSSELLDTLRIKDQVIKTTNTIISHGLNREINGWIITDKDGVGDIYKVSSNTKTITLISSVEVTVDILVF